MRGGGSAKQLTSRLRLKMFCKSGPREWIIGKSGRETRKRKYQEGDWARMLERQILDDEEW
jgi:hypothetical protein